MQLYYSIAKNLTDLMYVLDISLTMEKNNYSSFIIDMKVFTKIILYL